MKGLEEYRPFVSPETAFLRFVFESLLDHAERFVHQLFFVVRVLRQLAFLTQNSRQTPQQFRVLRARISAIQIYQIPISIFQDVLTVIELSNFRRE